MLVHRKKIHIEWGDCDPGGIVYFPRYFEYFDACTNAMFESVGLPKAHMVATYGIAGIPLVEAKASFRLPSQFGEDVVVESRVAEWGRSSFRIEHRLFKGEEVAIEATEKRVWVGRDGAKRFKAQAIPQDVKERFAGKHGKAGESS